jgi:DNA primase
VSYLPIRPRINEQVGASERLAFRYLVRRGVSPEQIALYRLGYANSGKYCGYVIVPIVRRREVIYFVARSFLGGNGARKYLNPSRDEVGGIGKSELLFNYDRVSYAPILTITEGVFDAIAVGTNAVALLGKTISDVQLALLENLRVRRIRVMLDEDARAECYTMVDQLNDAGFDATPALVDGDPSSSRGRAVDVLPSFTGRVEALLAQGGRR